MSRTAGSLVLGPAPIEIDGEWQRAIDRIATGRLPFALALGLLGLATLPDAMVPPLLRQLRLAPLAIETPVCEADLLYPPIGAAPADIVHTTDDLTPPSDGTPVDIDGPLHPRYSGGAS